MTEKWNMSGTLKNETSTASPCVIMGNVTNSSSAWCAEGTSIESGGNCTARCGTGYMPREPVLVCQDGVFWPPALSCIDWWSCLAPTDVPHSAADSCAEGSVIPPGHRCTLTCSQGYTATPRTLRCVDGNIIPRTFRCDVDEVQSNVTNDCAGNGTRLNLRTTKGLLDYAWSMASGASWQATSGVLGFVVIVAVVSLYVKARRQRRFADELSASIARDFVLPTNPLSEHGQEEHDGDDVVAGPLTRHGRVAGRTAPTKMGEGDGYLALATPR